MVQAGVASKANSSTTAKYIKAVVYYGKMHICNVLPSRSFVGVGGRLYNTLNQVAAQQTPDAGISQFWYDRLGRLAISQNGKQKAVTGTETGRQYSYTLYDGIGRITEVGQITNAMTDVISRSPGDLSSWLSASVAESLRKFWGVGKN